MLVGDLLMSWAGQLFTTCGLPAAYLSRARPLWAVLARELVAGECLEILRTGGRPDTAASLQVIRYETAEYTVEHPLHIGGALAGASQELRELFTDFGLPRCARCWGVAASTRFRSHGFGRSCTPPRPPPASST